MEQFRKPDATGITLRRPLVVALALVLMVVLGALGTAGTCAHREHAGRRLQAIPQAAQLMERSQPLAALKLLQQAEQYAPSSPALIRLKEDLARRARDDRNYARRGRDLRCRLRRSQCRRLLEMGTPGTFAAEDGPAATQQLLSCAGGQGRI